MRPAALVWMIAIAGVAHAEPKPPPERLDRDEIIAAGKAARARLPPVDRAAVQACEAKYGAATRSGDPGRTPETLAAAAACWRAAGSLGVAIRLWMAIVSELPDSREAVEARRQLGPAYEAAGTFSEAAEWHAAFAKANGAEKDARDQLIRAICIWRQLGLDDKAAVAEQDLGRMPGRKIKSAKLCETVRPIAAPK
jgi:hypothetical protein